MKVVVFGATGRTGVHVVTRSLGHGHDVTAFAHRQPMSLKHPRLTVLTGDVRDFVAVSAAVGGQHAVAFALSQADGAGADIHEAGIANVIHAMAADDVARLAAVSAAGVFARTDRRLSLGYRALIATTRP